MYCNLLFNGCSYTFGAELQGKEDDVKNLQLSRFSHLVSEHFNYSYSNISVCGRSNDAIVESTINWIESGNSCKMAIIQFSSPRRTILYTPDKREVHLNDIPKVLFKSNPHMAKRKELSLDYYGLIYTDYLGEQNFYKNLFLLNSYFSDKKIPVIFLSMGPLVGDGKSGWKSHCKDISIKEIVGGILPENRLDKKYYCKNYSMDYKENPKFIYLTGGHPNELGHKMIADYLINTIKSRGY